MNTPHFHIKQTKFLSDGTTIEFCLKCDWTEELESPDRYYEDESDYEMSEESL